MVVAVISPHPEAQEVIAKVLEHTGRVEAVWSLTTYPAPSQLKDLPQDPDGCVVFLDFSDYLSALQIAMEARSLGGSLQIVAMMAEPGLADELARLGIRQVIGLPPAALDVLRAFTRLALGSELPVEDSGGSGRIFAFLPARPGAGATTLAVHTAAAVARLSNQRTLLIDFDFRLGMTSFLLKLPGQHSVIDALNDIEHVDERWESLINRRGCLDVLGSAPQEFLEGNLETCTAWLLNFVRGRYRTVVLDLPGEMREYEIDSLRRATNCFLVCNSDIGVMHMAQRKAELLRSLGLEEKTSVIVNRAGGLGMIATGDVEAILKLPVRFSVANAYKEIAVATQAATTLEGRGGVITQIENIARWMMPQQTQTATEVTAAEETSTRKFLEFFTTGGARAGGR
jgi:pilus assembly protein CpaE